MRWIRACAMLGVLGAGACELFFPFDVAVDGGADAQLDVTPMDATTDVHADADASLPDVTVATTLYSFVGKGAGLAVDGQNLYWFLTRDAGPSLMVTNKADGGTHLLFGDAGINATGIALDDARVYWVTFTTAAAPNGGSVFSVGKDGGVFRTSSRSRTGGLRTSPSTTRTSTSSTRSRPQSRSSRASPRMGACSSPWSQRSSTRARTTRTPRPSRSTTRRSIAST